MSAAEYSPIRGSVAFKVIAYLTENPGARLNQSSISEKFECQYSLVHSLLGPAVNAGILARGEDPDSTEVAYTLAKRRSASTANIVRAKASALPAIRAPALNLDAIEITGGVPVPGTRKRRAWEPVFDRMKVGDSFAVSLAYRSTLAKAAADYRKADKGRMTLRRVSDVEVRVWRVA